MGKLHSTADLVEDVNNERQISELEKNKRGHEAAARRLALCMKRMQATTMETIKICEDLMGDGVHRSLQEETAACQDAFAAAEWSLQCAIYAVGVQRALLRAQIWLRRGKPDKIVGWDSDPEWRPDPGWPGIYWINLAKEKL